LNLEYERGLLMKITSTIRAALVGLLALVAFSTASRAESGSVTLTIYKAGWVIGGSGGSGVLDFRGRRYGLSTGGLDYGLVFGGSKTVLHGRVSNIRRPSDVAGVYAAAGAGLTVGRGARAIILTNQKGAVLELTGRQVGLMANVDLSGLAITLK
jgi:lipid-binding SYLF domain-containing protein